MQRIQRGKVLNLYNLLPLHSLHLCAFAFKNSNSLLKLLTLLILCNSCATNDTSSKDYAWQEIYSRDDGIASQRIPTYRAKIPTSWKRIDPHPDESIVDSTKPNCEFWITDNDDSIRITFHSFPTDNLQQRIPPGAQISRWKNQFELLEPSSVSIEPHSTGGFIGFYFTGFGTIEGQAKTMLGWSMQLANEHYITLQLNQEHNRQMRADYTIKVVGSPRLIDERKNEIVLFANSLELIEEITTR